MQKARDVATGSERDVLGDEQVSLPRSGPACGKRRSILRRAKLAEPLLNGPPGVLAAMYEASGDFDLAAAELTGGDESLSGGQSYASKWRSWC